jgi:hypothetical protein
LSDQARQDVDAKGEDRGVEQERQRRASRLGTATGVRGGSIIAIASDSTAARDRARQAN